MPSRKHHRLPGRRAGITALDLLITLAVIAVAMAIAVPALRDYSANYRLKAALGRFHASLAIARAEAIGRSTRIVICPADADGGCAATGAWQRGWKTFVDTDDDREHGTDEILLRSEPDTPQVRILTSVHRTRLRFFANGSAPGSNATITFCDARGARSARQVTLSPSGRIHVRTPEETDHRVCEA